jgi:hypothetical protein
MRPLDEVAAAPTTIAAMSFGVQRHHFGHHRGDGLAVAFGAGFLAGVVRKKLGLSLLWWCASSRGSSVGLPRRWNCGASRVSAIARALRIGA